MMPYALVCATISVASATALLVTAFFILPRWQDRSAGHKSDADDDRDKSA
jgi:hypothetical protein